MNRALAKPVPAPLEGVDLPQPGPRPPSQSTPDGSKAIGTTAGPAAAQQPTTGHDAASGLPRVAAVVVTHNRKAHLKRTVRCLRRKRWIIWWWWTMPSNDGSTDWLGNQ